MLYFWLVAAIAIIVIVTVMGFKDSFEVWGYYYVLAAIAIMAFLSRRWMMKRLEKNHQEFYGDKSKEETENR
jgi:hypothetical protein